MQDRGQKYSVVYELQPHKLLSGILDRAYLEQRPQGQAEGKDCQAECPGSACNQSTQEDSYGKADSTYELQTLQ